MVRIKWIFFAMLLSLRHVAFCSKLLNRAATYRCRRPSSSFVTTTQDPNHRTCRRAHTLTPRRVQQKDFFIEIIDDVDGQLRRVHVLETWPDEPSHPPLILVGGTAQVINSWIGHIQALSRDRRFIIYEARGQGKTELSLEKASIHVHVKDFQRITEALRIEGPVDMTGFSFGGRVALGIAAEIPDAVRRLVLTGVPADRDALGRLIIQSWRSSLQKGHLEDFAWNSMLHCHDRAFLEKNEAKIQEWIQFVVKSNRAEGILSIVTKSHVHDVNDPYHCLNLARRVKCPTLLMGGEVDRIATPAETLRLAAEGFGGGKAGAPSVILLPQAGHNCVFESPKAWRDQLLAFLS